MVLYVAVTIYIIYIYICIYLTLPNALNPYPPMLSSQGGILLQYTVFLMPPLRFLHNLQIRFMLSICIIDIMLNEQCIVHL